MNERKIPVSENLEKLVLKLKNRADIFVVGGYVRNAAMGMGETDVDLASEISPDELKQLLKYSDFKVIDKSKKLGTVLIKIGDEEYEHTTFRKEEYDDSGKHRPEKAEFVSDIREDAKRRDFTCNCVYYNLTHRRYVDIYSGLYDISKSLIKCVETPTYVFQNDGLRILRMVRQAAELNYKIDKSTYFTAKSMTYRLKDISGQRKLNELKLILYADQKYSISKPKAHLKALNMFNDLRLFPLFYVPCDRVKLTMLKKVKMEDRFVALLIDIVNAVNPDCVEYYLKDLLGSNGLCMGKAGDEYIKIVCGYFDALNRRNNKEYFFKYFDNFNIIREYLKYTNKKLYEKYNFFYRYILNQKIPVRIKDLNIDGNDIKKALPKLEEKNISKILKQLLDEVFANEIANEKSELIKEVKKIGNSRNY
ncbi:MAG: CCA tRNA nucleotidyltransferase [Clostridiales bacterium]|nr:CCA tRNA nucleotidyltransferase [Clostridiales bacterium]